MPLIAMLTVTVVAVAMVTATVAIVTAAVVLMHYARRKSKGAEYGEGQNVPKKGLKHNRRFFKGRYSELNSCY
jgi:hypothetical protein